jgi:hypothetical protein
MTCFWQQSFQTPIKSELLDFQHNQIYANIYVISNLDQRDYSKQCNGALSDNVDNRKGKTERKFKSGIMELSRLNRKLGGRYKKWR